MNVLHFVHIKLIKYYMLKAFPWASSPLLSPSHSYYYEYWVLFFFLLVAYHAILPHLLPNLLAVRRFIFTFLVKKKEK